MFNMQDPIVGGFGLEKVALRRAISLAYNQAEAIKQLHKMANAEAVVRPSLVYKVHHRLWTGSN